MSEVGVGWEEEFGVALFLLFFFFKMSIFSQRMRRDARGKRQSHLV